MFNITMTVGNPFGLIATQLYNEESQKKWLINCYIVIVRFYHECCGNNLILMFKKYLKPSTI